MNTRTAVAGATGLVAGLLIGGTVGLIAGQDNGIKQAQRDLADVREDAAKVWPYEPDDPRAPAPQISRPTDATIPGDGTWKVGNEIKPGEYRTDNLSTTCYYERWSGTTGEIDEIIANNTMSAGPIIVTIEPTDVAFRNERCGIWKRTS